MTTAILAATTMMGLGSTGCLVLGEPDFREPTPTKPIITPLRPTIGELQILEGSDTAFSTQDFVVGVVSEDAGQVLNQVLFLDYGVATDLQLSNPQPWAEAKRGPDIRAGVLTDPNRTATMNYDPDLRNPNGECHTITYQVFRTHFGKAPYQYCPTDDQFARVTWYVALCDEALTSCDFSQCPDVTPTVECPKPETLAAQLDKEASE